MVDSVMGERAGQLAREIAEHAQRHSRTIAVAESLTGGQLGAALAAAPNSASWFCGGIIAYHREVKYTLLETPRGPVVTEATAIAMAESSRRLLLADIAVAVTGVGGPGPDEGKPAGTVVLATASSGTVASVATLSFTGSPVDVIEQTVEAALEALLWRLRATGSF